MSMVPLLRCLDFRCIIQNMLLCLLYNCENHIHKAIKTRCVGMIGGKTLIQFKNGNDVVKHANNLALLELYHTRSNCIPATSIGVDWAVINGNFKMVQWLASQNIYCTHNGAKWAAKSRHFKIVQWLASQNIEYPL